MTDRPAAAFRLLLYAAIAAVAVVWILRPVNDPDFFWHLKTGEWIWQHKELPGRDPFNYQNQSVEAGGQRLVLTAYWLTQLLYHAAHSLLGSPGIVALRFLVVLLFAAAVLKTRRGDPLVHAALLLCTLLLLLVLFPLDRPQIFSFICFSTLLALLERERTGAAVGSAWRSCLPIALLMLVWANMHGGFAIGQLVVATYVVMEGVKFAHPALQPLGKPRYRRLLTVAAAGLGASLVNPNAWRPLVTLFALGPAESATNIEYFSTLRLFRETHHPLILVYWGWLGLTAVYCVRPPPRLDITRVALLVGTGYWGFSHGRLMPYFMIAALPAVAELLSSASFPTGARRLFAVSTLALAAYLARGDLPTRERVGRAVRVNSDMFPVEAADFVLANDLRGNLYNTYFWGGYLLWRLGPERKVFVDSRGINPQATRLSFSVNRAEGPAGAPMPYWKAVLRENRVDYAVVPRVAARGRFSFDNAAGLVAALLNDPEWAPVHADAIALVFARRTPQHREVIARHALTKNEVLVWELTHPAGRAR